MGDASQLEATVAPAGAEGRPLEATGDEPRGGIETQRRRAVFASDFDSRNIFAIFHVRCGVRRLPDETFAVFFAGLTRSAGRIRRCANYGGSCRDVPCYAVLCRAGGYSNLTGRVGSGSF